MGLCWRHSQCLSAVESARQSPSWVESVGTFYVGSYLYKLTVTRHRSASYSLAQFQHTDHCSLFVERKGPSTWHGWMALVNLTETISSSTRKERPERLWALNWWHQISQLAESPTNLSDTKAEANSIKGSNDCSHSWVKKHLFRQIMNDLWLKMVHYTGMSSLCLSQVPTGNNSGSEVLRGMSTKGASTLAAELGRAERALDVWTLSFTQGISR